MTTHDFTDITLTELERLRQLAHTAVVDVRDEWEYDEFNVGGVNIPLSDIRARKAELARYETLIVICTNGVRSRIAAKDLLRQPEMKDKTIYHLQGGLIEDEA